jgi:E3 ubiquitin-protein ligase mind-bomb
MIDLTSVNLSSTDKMASTNLACMLIQYGADLSIKNKNQQTPLDICSDPNLGKVLNKHFKEKIR